MVISIPPWRQRAPEKYRRLFGKRSGNGAKYGILYTKSHKSKVCRDEVEWFVKMVEERKQNNDHKKEKKNW